MCMNCVSSTEVVLGQVGLAAAVLRDPVHRALATAGLVAPIDPVRRDVRTVAFLRSLDLDPVEVLGRRGGGGRRCLGARALRPVGVRLCPSAPRAC